MNNFKIIRSKRKSISLEIQSDGTLVVRSPSNVPVSFIDDLLEKKKNWIEQKLQIVNKRNSHISERKFKEGEKFYYLGKEFDLNFSSRTQSSIIFDNGFIVSSSHTGDNAGKLIKHWYKTQAEKIIFPCVTQIAKQLNLDFNDIKITSAEKRWGSCTGKKTLNFAWRIIMLPPEIIEYIVVHELAHLKQLNHSKKFWNEVRSILPDYKTREKWLKENSYKFKF